MVECHLAKVDVEGSNPFSRSKKSEVKRPVRGAPSTGFFMLSTDAVHFAVHLMAISNITRLDAPEGTRLTAKPRKRRPSRLFAYRSSSTHTRAVSDVGFNEAGPSHQGGGS